MDLAPEALIPGISSKPSNREVLGSWDGAMQSFDVEVGSRLWQRLRGSEASAGFPDPRHLRGLEVHL